VPADGVLVAGAELSPGGSVLPISMDFADVFSTKAADSIAARKSSGPHAVAVVVDAGVPHRRFGGAVGSPGRAGPEVGRIAQPMPSKTSCRNCGKAA
jgi:hypothetical protein